MLPESHHPPKTSLFWHCIIDHEICENTEQEIHQNIPKLQKQATKSHDPSSLTASVSLIEYKSKEISRTKLHIRDGKSGKLGPVELTWKHFSHHFLKY